MPRRSRQASVRSNEGNAQSFSKRNISGIVSSDIRTQFPDTLAQNRMRIARYAHQRKCCERMLPSLYRDISLLHVATKNMQHF